MDGIQGNFEINTTFTHEPGTKGSIQENLDITGTTNNKITPALSALYMVYYRIKLADTVCCV